MIHIAIVEDEEKYRKQLREYIEQYCEKSGKQIQTSFFQDGEDIIENYTADFDLIFMDIQMRFMDGMTAAREIRKLDKKVILMFITSIATYAIEGYEVDALDYILKPLSYNMFEQKLNRALLRVDGQEEHYFLIQTSEETLRIKVTEIHYIESHSHIMAYHLPDRILESRGRLDDLEEQLSPYGFYRSNRGYLINLHYVTGVSDGCCIIVGNMLPVSRRKKAEFMEKLSQIL